MRAWLLFAVSSFVASCAGPSAQRAVEEPTLRILPLGDSVTQGRRGNGSFDDLNCDAAVQSYRYPLWKMLLDAGARFDFVGSMTGGFEGDPPWPDYRGQRFDRDHEGHWGWPISEVLPKLPGWLASYAPPDVALVLLGGNDASAGATGPEIAARGGALIDALRAHNPAITILWALPYHDWPPFPAYAAAMRELTKKKTRAQSPIVLVDMAPGWVSQPKSDCKGALTSSRDSCTVDWVHPNLRGDERLAQRFFAALQPVLQRHRARGEP